MRGRVASTKALSESPRTGLGGPDKSCSAASEAEQHRYSGKECVRSHH